jgi:hypothetical protein
LDAINTMIGWGHCGVVEKHKRPEVLRAFVRASVYQAPANSPGQRLRVILAIANAQVNYDSCTLPNWSVYVKCHSPSLNVIQWAPCCNF